MPEDEFDHYRGIFGINRSQPHEVEDLKKLARYITDSATFMGLESLTANSIPENIPQSSIPAGYTYLGQFITHDISFDSRSERLNTPPPPFGVIDLKEIENRRNTHFDLETIYGSNELTDSKFMQEGSKTLLKLDETKPSVGASFPESAKLPYLSDLPRIEKDGKKAVPNIIDSRNDETLLIAQTQVLFTKLHNAIVYKLYKLGNSDSNDNFIKAKQLTTRLYQYIILTDYLPKMVNPTVLSKVRKIIESEETIFFDYSVKNKYIPVEFSVAAFRVGHSMIRDSYNLNQVVNTTRSPVDSTVHAMMKQTGRGGGLTKGNLTSKWLFNWSLFYDIDDLSDENRQKFNFANPFKTQLANRLGYLLPEAGSSIQNSLSALDLFRGVALRLESGQKVARQVSKKTGAKILTEDEIESVFKPRNSFNQQEAKELFEKFKTDTPLWFYFLAEAEVQTGGETLGDVASWIFAEVILKLLYESPNSILMKGTELEFEDDFLTTDSEGNKSFSMPEMLRFIREIYHDNFAVIYPNRDYFDEINPIG